MKISDLFEESYSALTSNKIRTGLTMLGIVIGVGSVIAMISVGQGSRSSIESSIQSIGSNLIVVSPGAQRTAGVSSGRGSTQSLTRDDATAIGKNINGVKAVAPIVSSRYQITAKGTNTNTSVIGTTSEYASVRNVEIDLGSFITSQQTEGYAQVAVLGPSTRDDLFGENSNPIGKTIRINKIDFKVVGVTKAKGGSGFNNQDDVIYVPLTSSQQYLSGSKYLSQISVEATTADVMTSVQEQVTTLLLQRHKISDPTKADFSLTNQADIVATASSITGTFTTLLAAIAGISLVVGGIGIMNMMLTTVTERTREIGLRKAIGAVENDINFQFLTESLILTILGGIIGIILGWVAAPIITYFSGTATKVPLYSIVLAFGVSAGIGLVFGYYPARRASKLNPIEALRFE